MIFSYPLTIPSVPGNLEITWQPRAASVAQYSPFTRACKVYEWEGQGLLVNCKLPPIKEISVMKQWQVWLLKLNQQEGTFYLTGSSGEPQRGEATPGGYTPLVEGADQVGSLLETDGWPLSTTGVLKTGDWISCGGRLRRILADADSDGSGNATLTVWPDVRGELANNATILYGLAAKGVFRLTEDVPWHHDVEKFMSGFMFSAEEVILP